MSPKKALAMIVLFGVLFSLFFWFLEAAIHVWFFHGGTYVSELWPADENEFWMRSLTCMLIVIFSIGLGYLVNRVLSTKAFLSLTQSAFEVMAEAVVITDHHNHIIYVNPSYTKVTGYSYHDVKGRNPNVLTSGKQSRQFYETLWTSIEANGRWEGEVWNRRKSGELFTEWLSIQALKDKKGNTTHYVGVFSDITPRKEMEAHMHHYAFYDPLTNLPNRRFFTEKLQQALKLAGRQDSTLGVLFVDLDDFKPVNDQHGHLVGDQLLIKVAERLQSTIRESDIVARFGGDEFVVLLWNLTLAKDGEHVMDKITTALTSTPFTVGSLSFTVSASIGLAVYPEMGRTAECLLDRADQAMYSVKKQRKQQGIV